jgi:ABC-type polysaccharide/polyol phosphate transport system ATPase subunit
VEDVLVRFRPFVERRPTLLRTIAGATSRLPRAVTALDGVSFDVGHGEAFGIVGRNGGGKSTLLRVLAGTLLPNSGMVRINGKLSVLQLGLGFKRELSGLRNIYLGGLVAGLTRPEVERRIESIIDYSGIGHAIMRPVDTYSSGMFARLAFSIAIHLESDIVLLDEVLAVGDKDFSKKSLQSMTDLVERSGTVVYVSHNLASVVEFCQRAMWLEQGKVLMIGPAEEVVGAYRDSPYQAG